MNRSMEAHKFMQKRGFDVKSYGTGSCVKLPGTTVDKPDVYNFNEVTYEQIYQELAEKDFPLYTQNGVLAMLDRNRRIKPVPERFQVATKEKFDVVITCESRIFDEVLKDLEDRETTSNSPVHVVNIDIKDNHESATLGAMHIVQLATMMEQTEDLDNQIQTVLEDFEAKTKEPVLHATAFY